MNQDLSKQGWMGKNFIDALDTPGISSGCENVIDEERLWVPGEIPPPMFDIIHMHIVQGDDADQRYVLYSVRVQHGSARADLHTTVVDRRYTDFLNLYEGLRKQYPDKLNSYSFPKKAIVGNFSTKLMTERSKRFEALLKLVADDSKLRESLYLLYFLQDKELKQALELCGAKRYDLAEAHFKTSFRLLNKVYTDRSPAVLLSLCRLVGCYGEISGYDNASAERWATLALHRYESVSDSDLLKLYGPLLETCLKIWERNDQDTQFLMERLTDMKRRGMHLQNKSLLDAAKDLDPHFRLDVDVNGS